MILTGDTAKACLKELLSASDTHKYKLKYQAELKDDKSYGYFFEDGQWYCFDNRFDCCLVQEVVNEECAIGWCNGEILKEQGLLPFSFYQDSQIRMFERCHFIIYATSKEEAHKIVKTFDRETLTENNHTQLIQNIEHSYLYDTEKVIQKTEMEIFDSADNTEIVSIQGDGDILSEIMELSVMLAQNKLMEFYNKPLGDMLYEDKKADTIRLKEKYEDQYNKYYDYYYDKLINL